MKNFQQKFPNNIKSIKPIYPGFYENNILINRLI